MATLDKSLMAERTDLVTFRVRVDDKDVPKELHILSIVVESGVNKIPSATLVVRDGDPSIADFAYSNSGIFLPGKKIYIDLGYDNNDRKEDTSVFKGLITRNSHKIKDQYSELTIDCKHVADIMTYTKVNHIPDENSLDSDMISFILEKHKGNLKEFQVDHSDLKHSQVVQVNTTDWDFIMSRIDIAGMVCTFPASKLTIKKIPAAKGPAAKADETDLTLTYGLNILEFDCELDARVEPSIVKVQTWNYKDQKVDESDSGKEEGNKPGSNAESNAAKKLEYAWLINTPASMQQDKTESIARTKKLRQQLSRIKGSVKCLGTTKVVAGNFLTLKGVGDRFNGKAFVSNVVHEMGEGSWITTATLGWDDKLFAETMNPSHPASATGEMSSIQGLHVGKVSNIEDKDGEYRVKVKLPMVDKASEGIYARVATLDAGKDRGTFFRPEVDDEVVIGFMSDDPSNPVILGCVHSSNLKSPLEPDKNNHKKGYISRSAIKLLFDDDRKSLIIETPGKRVVELDDKEGVISMKDDFGNKIIMEKSGITIESAGDIIMKAKKEISATAQTQLGLKGNSGAKLEGSGPVTVQSSANTVIKGSMVMIN